MNHLKLLMWELGSAGISNNKPALYYVYTVVFSNQIFINNLHLTTYFDFE